MANEKLFLVPKSFQKKQKKNKDSYLCQYEAALGIIIVTRCWSLRVKLVSADVSIGEGNRKAKFDIDSTLLFVCNS